MIIEPNFIDFGVKHKPLLLRYIVWESSGVIDYYERISQITTNHDDESRRRITTTNHDE